MSKKRILHLFPLFVLVATFVVTACQPIRSPTVLPASGEQDTASHEELQAKIIAMEFATFDHLRQHDIAAVEAEISADYLWIDATGIKQRADYLAVVADEKLQFGEPERGEVEVRILSPTAVLVMYPMTTHGSYDGEVFTGHEYLSSLWMKRAGKWQNVFLQSSPQEDQEPEPPAATVDEQIQNALSAAPPAIAEHATIIDWPAPAWDQLVELRAGDNDWTCFPDDPGNPVNDPMCLDKMWMVWLEAVMTGTEPHYTGPGVSYMLQGGSDPSNTDPALMQPPEGHEWNITPAHVMFVFPDKLAPDAFSTDPNSGGPYIMYLGTPYEHVMVPVQGGETDEADAQIRNAMSAAPLAIAKDATILGWPSEEGGDMVVLREGSNDWTCIADWPVSPGNDPSCNDPVWTAWNDAYAKGEEPTITQPGFAYMLAGGSDPSNTDPMAMAPAPGEDWVATPPHIMLLVPDGFDATQFSTDHTSGEPYIMWEGTPYEHLMIPVNTSAMDMSK